jgi:hypothetical protein
MGTAVNTHNIKFLKIRAAFLTVLPVKNHNKAIRRILQHFVARKRQAIIFSDPFLPNVTLHTPRMSTGQCSRRVDFQFDIFVFGFGQENQRLFSKTFT